MYNHTNEKQITTVAPPLTTPVSQQFGHQHSLVVSMPTIVTTSSVEESLVYHSGQDPTENNLTFRVETQKVHGETVDKSTKLFIQKKRLKGIRQSWVYYPSSNGNDRSRNWTFHAVQDLK